MFLIQMAGFPGSGKSTLAQEIAKYYELVILDVDVIKTSLIETGVESEIVAKASYNTLFSLCDYYLSQEKNVIIDTPCYYTETVDNGIILAKKYNIDYKYIECRVEDFEEINNRLKLRDRKLSQYSSADKEQFYGTRDKSKRPIDYKYIIVDSSLPIATYIQDVLEYINSI